jgi:hypothetical protein
VCCLPQSCAVFLSRVLSSLRDSPPCPSVLEGVKVGVLVSMTVHPHSNPAASPATSTRLFGVYRQCVKKVIWARIQLESRGGVEEVTFWCNETTAAERKSKKRPPNARRQQYNRER